MLVEPQVNGTVRKRTMKYRRFGRTEIQMPLISVGGMRFQTSWKREDPVNSEHIVNLEKIVDHAVKSGMNHFETSHGYGTSEEELGSVLAPYNRDKLIIQTKVGPTDTVQEFLKNLEESMAMLKVDRLNLFAVHGINTNEICDKVLKKDGIMDALLKLKSEGVLGAVGFSTHAPPDSIVRTIQTDAFDYVNLWHSYIYPFNVPAIEEAANHDMGVFIISPNDKGGMLYDPPEKLVRLTSPLNPMTFNDIFILQNPDIHTISCGVAKPTDFDIHIEAVDKMDLLADEVEQIKKRLDAELEKVIDADWANHYLDGVPPQTQTPEGLNIPIVLWLWNLLKAFDMTQYAKMRYNLMGNAEHWFPGCKPEGYWNMDRAKLRRYLDASAYADRIMNILEEACELMRADGVNRLSKEE